MDPTAKEESSGSERRSPPGPSFAPQGVPPKGSTTFLTAKEAKTPLEEIPILLRQDRKGLDQALKEMGKEPEPWWEEKEYLQAYEEVVLMARGLSRPLPGGEPEVGRGRESTLKCPKCGSGGFTVSDVQARRADEGASTLEICGKCGYKRIF